MEDFNKLMQDIVNEDYDTLVNFSKKALLDVLPTCKKLDEDHNGMLLLTSFILSAIAADGVLTGLEKKFLGDVLGLDDELISKMIKLYDSKMVELVDAFVDNMDGEVSASAIMLVTCVAAVDEKISREETAFIRKLFA